MKGEGERMGGGDGGVGMLSAGLMFSDLRERTAADTIGGTNVVWTGVIPLPIPKFAPPQKPLAPILGEVGKSFCVLATASFSFLCSGGGESGPGGGKTGVSIEPRPLRRVFLRAAISWRRAMFSDLEEPSSERMAEMRESREAISASRDEIYSVGVKVSTIQYMTPY